MKPTFDGGYIAVGTVTNTETAARDMWLVKTNDTGKVVWSKRLGFNTANGEVGQDVIQQTDSSYAFIGKTNFYGSFTDGMIGVVSAEGSTQWIKQFGYNNGDDGYSLVQNGDKLVAFGCTCYLSYFNSVHKTQQEGDTCCNLFPAKWLKGIYASKCHRNGKSRGSTC
ncbi:hypothetical protein BW716_26595 [[Flexibacter] sp. ATCC 35208]|nr:hypothetical protein BW716_26595 [[Flexibacter] sp. ATCC 35208]